MRIPDPCAVASVRVECSCREYGVALQSRMELRVQPRLAQKILRLQTVKASDELS
jgi:hypothetical protein